MVVSFIVLSYNQEATIIRTLNSIVNQNLSDYEIIVCDDCSRDNTVKIVQQWIQDKNLSVIVSVILQIHNRGITENFVTGVRRSKGDYVKVIAGDDWFADNSLNKIVPILLQENYPACYCNLIKYNEKENRFISLNNSFLRYFAELTPERQFNELLYSNKISAPAIFIKRPILVDLLPCLDDYKMLEDYPLWLELSYRGHKIFYIDIDCVYYMQSDKNISAYTKGSLKSNTLQKKYFNDFIKFKMSIPKKYQISAFQKVMVKNSINTELYTGGLISKFVFNIRNWFYNLESTVIKIINKY